MSVAFHEEFINVGGSKIQVAKGGSGAPLLILHGAEGTKGWMRTAQALAERFTVYLPSHPGYYQSERPAWLGSMIDLARFYLWFINAQGLQGVRLLGHSMGGWLAAEMAVSCHHAISKLMLVDAVGMKPANAGSEDLLNIPPAQVRERAFYDPQQIPDFDQLYGQPLTPEEQQVAMRNQQTMLSLLKQSGDLYPPALRGLLPGIAIPTRIVWGRQDRIAPLECGEIYQQLIPGAELSIIDKCSHRPYVEKPDEFIKVALEFFS